jgi:hypothetical protein
MMMTQDEFREAMNRAKREDRFLWVTNGTLSGIALGYDSGSKEAILHKNVRVSLDGLREDKPTTQKGSDNA